MGDAEEIKLVIKEWISLDDENRELQKQQKILRDKKVMLSQRILEFMRENQVDNFNLEDGHVIPSLIHKCYLAMQYDIPFEIRGTGKPLRQFIYSLDLAHLIMKLLSIDYTENIILSPEDEYSIEYVAESINRHFQNEMVFNKNYSDGQYRKTADNSKLKKLINSEWSDFKFTDLDYGIEQTVKWFIENYETLRK